MARSTKPVAFILPRRSAKRQALSSRVLTPDGWSTIGKIRIGDFVIGSDGKPTMVTGLSETTEMPLYRLTTRTGRSTLCDAEHLWTVDGKAKDYRRKTLTTKQISKNLYVLKAPHVYEGRIYKEYTHFIPYVNPICFKRKKLPLDPYLLGILLGDGCLVYNTPRFTCDVDDWNHYYRHIFKYDCSEPKQKKDSNAYSVNIRRIYKQIQKLDLFGTRSNTKFIPKKYLFASIEQRVSLLQGMMDTDGTICSGTLSYSTISKTMLSLITRA